jgi:hypothetical protein
MLRMTKTTHTLPPAFLSEKKDEKLFDEKTTGRKRQPMTQNELPAATAIVAESLLLELQIYQREQLESGSKFKYQCDD